MQGRPRAGRLLLIEPNLALWSIIARAGLAGGRLLRGAVLGRHGLDPAGDLRGRRAGRRDPVHAVLPGHRCRCCGTPSRSPGSTSASRRSTRSPWSTCSRWTAAARTAPPPCWPWRSTATRSVTRKYGYASAMGVALFFLTLTFAALTLRVTRRETRRVLMSRESTMTTDTGGATPAGDRPPARAGAAGRAAARSTRSPALAHVALIVWALDHRRARSSGRSWRRSRTPPRSSSSPWTLPGRLRWDDWGRAWTKAHVGRYFLNSVFVVTLQHVRHDAARLDGRVRAGPLQVPRQPGHLLPVRVRAGVPGRSWRWCRCSSWSRTWACSTPTPG